jgi:DNA-binding response OmpR family regulator
VKLLLVDSDRDMVDMLSGWLRTHGYEIHFAHTGERARFAWLEYRPDLVIIDAAMRDVDTLSLCRSLQTMQDALIMVVAAESDVQTEIRCLESGVDDYLRKPFHPRQLLARIHALSRRSRTSLSLRPVSITQVGPLRVDSLRNIVTVYDKTVRLTPTESKLLHMLALNANDVCQLEQIVTHVWGYDGDGDTYLIKAHIHHLREKIELDPSNPRFILTVPGVGYTLVRTPDERPDKVEIASGQRRPAVLPPKARRAFEIPVEAALGQHAQLS